MRLSRDYVDRIISAYSACEAISTIGQLLSPRIRRNMRDPGFGLTRPEFTVQLYAVCTGEVGNGGHCQFFLNSSGNRAKDTIAGLHDLGLAPMADLLSRATAAFPDACVPKGQDEREALIQSLSGNVLDVWNECDQELYRLVNQSETIVLDYIRANRNQFLRPEMGES
jgi:hypothetical protein